MGRFGVITKVTFKIYATEQKQEPLKKFPSMPADLLFEQVQKEIDPDGLFLPQESKKRV
jgi:FAD/FMN-containing dehydrogenase